MSIANHDKTTVHSRNMSIANHETTRAHAPAMSIANHEKTTAHAINKSIANHEKTKPLSLSPYHLAQGSMATCDSNSQQTKVCIFHIISQNRASTGLLTNTNATHSLCRGYNASLYICITKTSVFQRLIQNKLTWDPQELMKTKTFE